MITRRRVAVIGGGITGLAAAWELTSDPTLDVVLIEAAPRLGGKIRTSRFAGRMVDEGADAFLRRVPEGLALADELGIADGLVSPSVGAALVWAGGELRPLPTGHVLGVPIDPDALAASRVVSDAAVDAVRREPSLPGGPMTRDETVASLVRRRFGDEILDVLVEPLVGGINAGEADRLSVDAVVPQIAAAARASGSLVEGLRAAAAAAPSNPGPVFSAPAGGMGVLVEELVAGLAARGAELHVDTVVDGLEHGPTGWTLAAATGGIEVDAVVIATPAGAAAGLVRPHAAVAADLLAGIDHASVALVALAVPRTSAPAHDASGFLVPRSAGLTITAASFASTKWAHLAGLDTDVLRVSCGHRDDPSPLELSDDDLVATVERDLATVLGNDVAPTEVHVTRYVDGFPQYDVGHLDRVAAIEGELRDRVPSLVVAGAAMRGLGVPSCIRQGRGAAHQAIASLEGGS